MVVARRHRTTNATVGKWRTHFIERGLSGLYDEPRVGGPRTASGATVEAVIVRTLEPAPAGETHWSTRTMAAKAGLSHTMVSRIWRTVGLEPHVSESFTLAGSAAGGQGARRGRPLHRRAQPILPMDVGRRPRLRRDDGLRLDIIRKPRHN